MSLESKFSRLIPDAAKAHGEALLDTSNIQLYRSGPLSALAESFGEDAQETTVQVENKELLADCSCDAGQQGHLCGHVWATLLLSDRQGELQKAASRAVRKAIRSVHCADNQNVSTPVRPTKRQTEVLDESPDCDKAVIQRRHISPKPETEPVCDSLTPSTKADADWRIIYIIDGQETRKRGALVIAHYWQSLRNGNWSSEQAFTATRDSRYPSDLDRGLCQSLANSGESVYAAPFCWGVPTEQQEDSVIALQQSGRLLLRHGQSGSLHPVTQLDAAQMVFNFRPYVNDLWHLSNRLTVDGEDLDLSGRLLLLASGILLSETRVIFLNPNQSFWLSRTLDRSVVFSEKALRKLSYEAHLNTTIPSAAFPEAFRFTMGDTQVCGRLYIRTAQFKFRGTEQLHAELAFNYEGVTFEDGSEKLRDADLATRTLVERHLGQEEALRQTLLDLGFRYSDSGNEEVGWKLLPSRLDQVVPTLVNANWIVMAEGKTYRKPQEMQARVSYNMDWLELHGTVTFGDEELAFPELIAVAKTGATSILLGDGNHGILPLEWLKNYTVLTEIGLTDGDLITFKRGQFLLVGALLAEQEGLIKDVSYHEQLKRLEGFSRISPADPCDAFHGELRDYQKEGLGWMTQLGELDLGICLADDMGLGKTIQVLALLSDRLHKRRPSLIVLPKSLIFNWQAEAAKFCPKLRVINYTGAGRKGKRRLFSQVDAILTTYGTMRRDILYLKTIAFDYCILDESQAIKNAESQNAKAARLLQADHRVIMTGTPIENHLGELLSQFEFINPGMLGRLNLSKETLSSGSISGEQIQLLQRAIKPFFLRRTKEEVAKELPEKTVQVLYCELNAQERQRYDELKHHFQKEFLPEESDADGDNKNTAKKVKKPIFQALLRLRQAACHPGLSNPKLLGERSSKQTMIAARMAELAAEGHKLLIFSQFTSMLAILQQECTDLEIPFTYLDGQTKDRDAEVSRFQNDESVKVFLISLKAGGVGLNLTAADYVFLIDPWWNPAIEAQAIDRAYRIGQNKHVFAYKMIARNTIEEKVLHLQQEKQDLANSVFSGDPAAIRSLTRDDLLFILS